MPTTIPHAYLIGDLETTDKDRRHGEVWAAAFTLEDDHRRSLAECDFLIEHTAKPVPWVVERTGYTDRYESGLTEITGRELVLCISDAIAASGAERVFLTGMNIGFDDAFLSRLRVNMQIPDARWYVAYAPIELKSMTAGAFGLKLPPNARECAELLGVRAPVSADTRLHGAAIDRDIARDVFHALEDRAQRRMKAQTLTLASLLTT